MASMMVVVAMALLVATSAYAADHTVGGSSGWDTSGNYDQWAAGETFTAGDTITFTYGGLHSVSQVSKSDYSSCSASNAIKTDSSGTTTFPLDKPGTTYYYICGTPGHCSEGMKVAVTTAGSSDSSGSSSTPSSSTTPSTGTITRNKPTSLPSAASAGPRALFVGVVPLMGLALLG